MRWLDEEQGVCLEFDDPVTWVWLLQLMQLLREEKHIPNLRLAEDLQEQEEWQEWVKPELETWQNECLEVVQKALEEAGKQPRQLRQLRLGAEDLDAWVEVLGRARLLMEERWKLSSWKMNQAQEEPEMLPTIEDLLEEMPKTEPLNFVQREQILMRFHFYGSLEERMVLKISEMSFPEEQDPLGYEADIVKLQEQAKELNSKEADSEQEASAEDEEEGEEK